MGRRKGWLWSHPCAVQGWERGREAVLRWKAERNPPWAAGLKSLVPKTTSASVSTASAVLISAFLLPTASLLTWQRKDMRQPCSSA